MSPVVRHVLPRIREALTDTRIVVVQGARQVGKTTLVQQLVTERGGTMVSFDDALVARSAREDPIAFLNADSDRLLAIDEVQRVPELILALKYVVDRDTRPGRFLLTGSANLLRLPVIEDSLAGRTENIELHPFSQGELGGHREQFVTALLAGERFLTHTSPLHRQDYLERAVVGGYPEAVNRTVERRRNLWLDNYIRSIIRREADDISNLQRVADLPRILQVLAARNSGELNIADVARDTEIPARTLTPYLELLQTLYLTQHIPAWSTNLTKRAVSKPKVSLLDSGLAARLMHVSSRGASPAGDPKIAGGLLKGFVAGELRRQFAWTDEPVRLCHFRDAHAGEVDLILESPDGRVAGLEVKATSRPAAKDFKGLAALRDKLGKRFVGGVLLHTGPTAVPMGERISAVPLDVLWQT